MSEKIAEAMKRAFLSGYACGMDHEKDGITCLRQASEAWKAEQATLLPTTDPTSMQQAASTPGNLAHALYADDPEAPYCDAGCGDRATVRMEHVGLCDEHAADAIRETLEPLLGKRCAMIGRDGEGNLTVCLTAYGVEHAHASFDLASEIERIASLDDGWAIDNDLHDLAARIRRESHG